MRRPAIALVVALLLLPVPRVSGGPGGEAEPVPLDLFGGDGPLAGNPGALVVETYYNALRADEYVVVASIADGPLDLGGWSLSDGEGTLTFPPNSIAAPGELVVVAQNSTAYAEDTLGTASFRYRDGNATRMFVSGTFQLNNAGDEVILQDASGTVVDVLAYGASAYAGPGWEGPPALRVNLGYVAHRDRGGAWRDTNTSTDWDLVRVRSLGQRDLPPGPTGSAISALAFVSPDDSLEPLTELLESANETIDVSLYTFTSTPLAESLLDALARGVRVRVLLEGGPVGGIMDSEGSLAESIATAGGEVHFLVDNTGLDIQERYRFGHAKYAILDGETVIVSTENWGASGFPPRGTRGNRGWSLAVTDASVAAYFAAAFEEDFNPNRRDVVTLDELAVTLVPAEAPDILAYAPRFPPLAVTGPIRTVPVLGPDTTLAAETILGVLGNATESIHAEVFYAHRQWGPFPNAYLEALIDAARRGVSVRLLLDSTFFNTEDDDPIDNDDTVAYVNGIAANEGLDLEAKLLDLGAHGLRMLHAKGFVVDGRTVLVSSVNWNRNSPTANREAGLIVEHDELGAYFEGVFASDWKDDVTAPHADAGPDRRVVAGERALFSGLGSHDDVGVTNFSWDFEGDGAWDAWGPEVSHVFVHEGTSSVRLRVADAGNNTDTDEVIVTVSRPSEERGIDAAFLGGTLATATLAAVAWLALRLRRKKGLNKRAKM